jgi:sulfite reductase (NADPH) flavoprotein alpha-component
MQPVYVVYGTESFNTEDLAERTGEALAELGLPVPVKVVDMDDFDVGLLPSLHTLIVLTSTYGNGDPPSNAEALHSHLMKKAPPLPQLRFAVCGLGDSVYPHFAQCGKDFDRRLGELGATRLLDRQDCDVDYEAPWAKWLARIEAILPGLAYAETGVAPAPPRAPEPPPAVGTRKHPYLASVRFNRRHNDDGTSKEVRHVELELPPTLELQPGDSVGIWPTNAPELVAEILEKTGFSGEVVVKLGDESLALAQALATRLDLAVVDARLIQLAAQAAPKSVFNAMAFDAGLRQGFAARHHVVDLVSQVRLTASAQAFVDALRPLAPRLYSLASSRKRHPDAAHLLVSVVEYELSGRRRTGVFSAQLRRTPVGEKLPVFVHPSPHFRVPADDAPALMIGAGTGVSPYRGFLQEREARGAKGKNWLVFGERNAGDRHYLADWLTWQQRGLLTRLDFALSREYAQKTYVQHVLEQNAAEVYAWIVAGAVIYVCGDARQMAGDVHQTLKKILMQFGGLDEAGADLRLTELETSGRYQRDVY